MDMQNTPIHASSNADYAEYLKFISLDPDESIVCVIKKHPFGAIAIHTAGFFVTVVTILFGIFMAMLASKYLDLPKGSMSLITLLVVLISLVSLYFTYVSSYVYRKNAIVVTSEKVVRVMYKNLVDRKITQISLGEVEDVSVSQSGMLSRSFGYGLLRIKTSGEGGNFDFSYAPTPYDCANQIVEAHELVVKKYGN
jgi:hypothetical protein